MQHACIPAPQPCMWSDLLFQALTPDFSAVLSSAKRLGFEVYLCSLWLPLSERFVTMIGQVPKTDSHEAQHSRLTDEETGGGGGEGGAGTTMSEITMQNSHGLRRLLSTSSLFT